VLTDYAKKSIEKLPPEPKSMADPNQLKAMDLYRQGSQKLKVDDNLGAINDFTLSINLYRLPIAFLERGVAELLVADYMSAINDLNEVIKMNPNLNKAYFARGACHYELNQYQAAEDDMERYIQQDKSNPIAYNYIAGCLYLKDNVKARMLMADGTYQMVKRAEGSKKINSQEWLMNKAVKDSTLRSK